MTSDDTSKKPESESSRPPRRGNRITRVYTRAGDAGTTQLVGGRTVRKDHPRIAAYGTVDELQVALGAAREVLAAVLAALSLEPQPTGGPINQSGNVVRPPSAGHTASPSSRPFFENLAAHLIYLQNLLFTAGADLATRDEDCWAEMPLIGERDIVYLETLIDALNASLPPLKDFVLPGGHPLATALHQCRVVCRRAEREVETLAAAEPIGDFIRPFLNRLSDLFFVLARRAAHELRAANRAPAEIIWRRDLPQPPLP